MESTKREELLSHWEEYAPVFGCRDALGELSPLHRCDLYTSLAFERLVQKEQALKEIFEQTMRDWNQTLFTMLFRTVGDLRNRNSYMELASRVSYQMVLRERTSSLRIEALIFGASGLLDTCREDAYIADLRNEFAYLSHKYDIRPMRASEWHIDRMRPANHPRLRLAQLSAFLSHNDFLLENILACRSRQDVERLFGVEASQYWSSYYNPAAGVEHSTKRIGATKAQNIGINLVAVLQFFYGRHNGKEELTRRAVELWEALPAEQNRYTRIWAGASPASAFESQAQLQLAREYCEQRRCRQCPLAARRLHAATH